MKCAICGAPLGPIAVQDIVKNEWYCSVNCKDVSKNRALTEGKGVKYDQGKLPYHLISPYALRGLAARLQHGATKYAERNWEEGLEWSRCIRAAMGHLLDFAAREDIDLDSGLPHIDAALCNLMFLSHYTKLEKYRKFDDRPDYTPRQTAQVKELLTSLQNTGLKIVDPCAGREHNFHEKTGACMSCGIIKQ